MDPIEIEQCEFSFRCPKTWVPNGWASMGARPLKDEEGLVMEMVFAAGTQEAQ